MPTINITRILYLEDDPGLSSLVQQVLQRRGFRVDVAVNGQDGLARVKAAPYDVLLMDYHIPSPGGIDVIRALGSVEDLPPMIMITGEGNEGFAVEALKLGAADYLVKDGGMKYLDLLPSVIDQVLLRQRLIDERKQLLATIRENEERNRLLIECNPLPIMIYDCLTLEFLSVNNAALSQFGYSREEFLSLTIRDLFPPDELPKLPRLLTGLGHGEKQTGIRRLRLKNASLIDAELVSLGGIMSQGKEAQVIMTNNVMERKKVEETGQKAMKFESLSILADGLAHDFNALLTGIIGNIALVKMETQAGSPSYERLEEARKSASHAQELTRRLLAFSRGEALRRAPLSAKKLIEASADFALKGSPSRCEFNLSSDLWPIEADEDQLSLVMRHLIMNADQSMPGGGAITIAARNAPLGEYNPLSLKAGDYLAISVSDQGAGIPPEDIEKIFDPSFTTKHRGSGLGLSTSSAVIKRHNGQITVESTPGSGSTFHIYLPACGNASCVKPDRDTNPARGSGRILIMDDEEMIREIAGKILNELGYETASASNGADAVSLYEEAMKSNQPFDAVIVDLTIPGGMGGQETVEKLREIDPSVQAIVSSGYSSDPIMMQFKDYGFRGAVSKPFTIKTLSESVKKIVSGKQGRITV